MYNVGVEEHFVSEGNFIVITPLLFILTLIIYLDVEEKTSSKKLKDKDNDDETSSLGSSTRKTATSSSPISCKYKLMFRYNTYSNACYF